eukprot:scaffold25307_cov109-Isochrysis_galbana.AAC.6
MVELDAEAICPVRGFEERARAAVALAGGAQPNLHRDLRGIGHPAQARDGRATGQAPRPVKHDGAAGF